MIKQYSETLISNRSQEDGRFEFSTRAELSNGVEFSTGVAESYSGAAESRNTDQQSNDNVTHGDISRRIISNYNFNQRYSSDPSHFSSSESDTSPSKPNSTEQRGRKRSESDSDVTLPSDCYDASIDDEQQRKKKHTNESLCRNTSASESPVKPSEAINHRAETPFRGLQQTDSFARLDSSEFSDVEFRVCTKQAIYVRDYALLQTKVDAIWSRAESSVFGKGQQLDRFRVVDSSSPTPSTQNSNSVVVETNANCCADVALKGVSHHRSCCETMPDSMRSDELQRMLVDTKLKVGYLQYEDLPEKLEIIVVHVCDSNHFWGLVANSEKLVSIPFTSDSYEVKSF